MIKRNEDTSFMLKGGRENDDEARESERAAKDTK